MTSSKREMGGLISVIHRKTQIYLNQELKKYGLNSAEFVYIIHIRDEGPTELKSLGAHLRMDDAQTTRVIRSLEEKGLVRKLRNQADRRAFDVAFTPEGLRVKPLIQADLDCWIALITQGIPEEEVDRMIQLLRLTALNAVRLTEGK